MRAHETPTAIVKAYDLLKWMLPHVAKFPREHRFTLGDRVETQGLMILELLVDAAYRREKVAQLEEANRRLETLRYLLRLGKDLQCLSLKSYEHAMRLMEALGREVGGWLRSQRAQPPRKGASEDETSRQSMG